MFKTTRLKLTAWYLLIIMAVSIFFSAFIYYTASREFDRALRMQRFRIEHPNANPPQPRFFFDQEQNLPPRMDPEVINEAKTRVLIALVGINVVILFLSSLLGFFLAGRTLKPIKVMIDEQNRFITNSSHELNTPITSLRTSIEVNLRDKNLTLQKAKKTLEDNLEDVNNLQLLTDELINLAKYQKINGNFKLENFLLLESINLALAKVKQQSRQKTISFKLNVPKITLKGDKKSITELFVILFDNAIKYSNEGKKIFVRAKKLDSRIAIEIEDQGIGIDKDDLPFIFDRFYRSDKSRTKQQAGGYGLGLSIAKRIVKLHNGIISIESEKGRGTTAKVTINA
jgi:two-component system, OmpR family, sensor histidine kinase CiaH